VRRKLSIQRLNYYKALFSKIDLFLQGEPGGPVNFKNPDNSWMAIGIVSYEHFLGGCQNDSSAPRPFTRVSSYLDWINCMIGVKSNSSCSIESISTSSVKPATLSTTESPSSSSQDQLKSSTLTYSTSPSAPTTIREPSSSLSTTESVYSTKGIFNGFLTTFL